MTKYDWALGRRGVELEPVGKKPSPQQRVYLGSPLKGLEWFYRAGRLAGQALEDAKSKFGEEPDDGTNDRSEVRSERSDDEPGAHR